MKPQDMPVATEAPTREYDPDRGSVDQQLAALKDAADRFHGKGNRQWVVMGSTAYLVRGRVDALLTDLPED